MEADREIIDCHCHILPRIDDGSQSVEESIGLLKEYTFFSWLPDGQRLPRKADEFDSMHAWRGETQGNLINRRGNLCR